MTLFTDPSAAIDEAAYLAEMSDRPQAIVRADGGLTVMGYSDAWLQRLEILESVYPTGEAA